MDSAIQKTITSLPHTSGVYLFKDQQGTVLYVGKAKDLKKRVLQYFKASTEKNEKTRQLVSYIRDITYEEVRTEFEALLLEAKYIKKYQPKYNAIAKDDKSPIYIGIEGDNPLPRVLLTRKIKKQTGRTTMLLFGPFQSVRMAQSILRMLRRSVPFCTQAKRNGRPCFYTHLGLCNPCPSVIERMEPSSEKTNAMRAYRRNVKKLIAILAGKTPHVIAAMEKEMKEKAKQERFEEANKLKSQMESLLHVYQTSYEPFQFEYPNHTEEKIRGELRDIFSVLSPFLPIRAIPEKIECIDISNIGGREAVASLVVFTNGLPDKNNYRRFRIRKTKGPNDAGMIGEVVLRRLRHSEWTLPDLLIVDGGKPQVRSAYTMLLLQNQTIPLIGLAKRREEIILFTHNTFKTLRIGLDRPAIHLVQRIRDEAHRFAVTYHKKRRSVAFLDKTRSH